MADLLMPSEVKKAADADRAAVAVDAAASSGQTPAVVIEPPPCRIHLQEGVFDEMALGHVRSMIRARERARNRLKRPLNGARSD